MAWVQAGTRKTSAKSSTATAHVSESKLEDLSVPASKERTTGSGAIEITEKWNRKLPDVKTLPDTKTDPLQEKLTKLREEERRLDKTKSDFPLEKRHEGTLESIASLKEQLVRLRKPSHTATCDFTGITSERNAPLSAQGKGREKTIIEELKRYNNILELQEKQAKLTEKLEKLGKK